MVWWLLPLALADDDWIGHTALAQGSAVVAAPQEIGSVAVNPAAIALVPFYDGAAYGSLGEEFGWGGGVVDAESVPGVTVGFTLRQRRFSVPWTDESLPGWIEGDTLPSNQRQIREGVVALAFPLFDRRLSFGVNGTIGRYQSERYGNGWAGNVDFGVAALPTPRVALGLVGRNLIPTDSPRPAPTAVLAGVRLRDADDRFAAEFDGGVERAGASWRPDLRAGFQLRPGDVDVRGGWRYDGQHYATAGIGYHNEAGSIGYALQIPIAAFDLSTQVHQLGLTLHIPAPGEDW